MTLHWDGGGLVIRLRKMAALIFMGMWAGILLIWLIRWGWNRSEVIVVDFFLIRVLAHIMRSGVTKVAGKTNMLVKLKNVVNRLEIISSQIALVIDQDTWACSKLNGAARDTCRKKAHYFCYSACFNVPDAISGGFGTIPPPACKGAANAIGGMW
jgi:hypothetical protein